MLVMVNNSIKNAFAEDIDFCLLQGVDPWFFNLWVNIHWGVSNGPFTGVN